MHENDHGTSDEDDTDSSEERDQDDLGLSSGAVASASAQAACFANFGSEVGAAKNLLQVSLTLVQND